MPDFNTMVELNVGLYIFAILITLFLLIGTLSDEGRHKPFMRSFMHLLLANVLMLTGEVGIWLSDGRPEKTVIMKICLFLSIGCSYLVVIFYAYCLFNFIQEKKKVSLNTARTITILCSIFAVLEILSIFTGNLFYIDNSGTLVYTERYLIVNIFDILTIFVEIALVLRYRKILTGRGTLILMTFSSLPLIAMPLQLFWDTTPIYMATTMSLIALYILFHGELARQLAEKERELMESRVATMISQIQPHFIYNTLGSIGQLCLEQPEKAAKLVQDFSLYLRGNFREIDNAAPISLSQELEHVRHYIDIEHIRFPDIVIQFHLNSGEFLLPALTIQPLVENAIKHGLMKLECGGTVTISTYETDKNYCISVVDDGVGFDTSVLLDKSEHIGIRNIRGRLEAMCGGSLSINSEPGKGTTALITIPKEDEEG